ncbi:hypothetical protein ACU635_03050 [[Actinomadura] parvosata]|uniref:hypothetical protein n=1 Tax=[Actinomadura] parvosata TaxID=1955412 RepID=UPI00406CB973
MNGAAIAAGGPQKTRNDSNDVRTPIAGARTTRTLRRVGVAALAAALLAGAATPAMAATTPVGNRTTSDGQTPVSGAVTAASGQNRPELQQAIQTWPRAI